MFVSIKITEMKKFIYISIIAVGLLAVSSCSKENIQPIPQNETSEIPVWKSASSNGSTLGGDASGDDGNITDPNNDKDENSKRKN